LEFSFDRSKDTPNTRSGSPANGPTAQTQSPPSVASQPRPAAPNEEVDPSTITNERLRKAIEKNRARQAERNRTQASADMAGKQESSEQASLFDRQQPRPNVEQPAQTPPPRPRAQERTHSSIPKEASTVVTRRSVAKPDEVEFSPVKRAPRKVSNQISYTTSDRKKSKQIDPTLIGYLVKGSWIFCGLMILRLIFANGGVTDFYSQRSLYSDRQSEFDRIKNENMQIVREIERMQTDTAYQKKLVRDNLGFIAADEFLILFPKEKSVQ
jgi:cell division protein FtsB